MTENDYDDIPIYEKIAPGECLIISRNKNSILVACNKDGDIEINRISYPTSEK